MIVPKACPLCREGDVLVEQKEGGSIATCQRCGYHADGETMRSQITLRALQDERIREAHRGA